MIGEQAQCLQADHQILWEVEEVPATNEQMAEGGLGGEFVIAGGGADVAGEVVGGEVDVVRGEGGGGVGKEGGEGFGVEDPDFGAAFHRLNKPAGEDDDGLDGELLAGARLEEVLQPAGFGSGLGEGVTVDGHAIGKQAIVLDGDDGLSFCRFAVGLGFYCVDSVGGDEHVVQVEALAKDVVKYLGAIFAEQVEVLADGFFAIAGHL